MSKSVIKCPWKVGDKLYLQVDGEPMPTMEDVKGNLLSHFGLDTVFPVVQVRVIGIRLYHGKDRSDAGGTLIPVTSATEAVYKVMRNRTTMRIALLTQDMEEIIRVDWPASKPFHDALGPIDDGMVHQTMYVAALNVDGHFKLLEVLDDQDW